MKTSKINAVNLNEKQIEPKHLNPDTKLTEANIAQLNGSIIKSKTLGLDRLVPMTANKPVTTNIDGILTTESLITNTMMAADSIY